MENLEFLKDFIKTGLTIDDNEDGSFSIFTIRTQRFSVKDLSELTYERFIQEEKNFRERDLLQMEMLKPLGEWSMREFDKYMLELIENNGYFLEDK